MSVRTGDRSEGTLGVLNEIRVLGAKTIDYCRNEKVFPKSSRWVMAKPIIDECIAALSCVRRANAVFVCDDHPEDWRYRRSEQVKAHSHLGAMLSLIDLAYTSFGIESTRIDYWTGHVTHADDRLKAWMKSDKERYTKMFENAQAS